MSMIIDNYVVPKHLDKRIKLSQEDREKIKELWLGGMSQRGLARLYNVNKTLIRYIVNPEAHEVAKKQYRERQKDGRYYSTKKRY